MAIDIHNTRIVIILRGLAQHRRIDGVVAMITTHYVVTA